MFERLSERVFARLHETPVNIPQRLPHLQDFLRSIRKLFYVKRLTWLAEVLKEGMGKYKLHTCTPPSRGRPVLLEVHHSNTRAKS